MNRVTKRAAALAFAAGAVFAVVGCNKPAAPGASPSPAAGDLQTDEQMVLYALGIILGQIV
jgi:hypothetical protein